MSRWLPDGPIVAACALAVIAAAALRGTHGAGHWVALVLAIDLAWLAALAWRSDGDP